MVIKMNKDDIDFAVELIEFFQLVDEEVEIE